MKVVGDLHETCYNVILKGKLAGNWQMDRILIILKKKYGPRASSASLLEPYTIVFKHNYSFIKQISDERCVTIGPLVILIVLLLCLSVTYKCI